MEFLGIGPSELIFIVIIALIVLGPRDMQRAGRTIGRWLRRLVTSDQWKLFQQTSREIQTLPNRLMREAALEELQEMQKDLRQPLDIRRPDAAAADPQAPQSGEPAGGPGKSPENTIRPPSEPTPPPEAARDDEDKDP